ncbi:MAG: DUF2974 domain-containing protein [Lactobacillus sp.]|uniref:DUF2974 domain-containing protein n=1 Tax=Lactobacillus sp. TaxID=1591 RepID=UPI0023C9DDDC|nr:DUF2974 domain-containing protein [Lactobacillus sp.]MDE7050177.1 DUF2974 domain-containing protein [Lactobacillus sp.]
MDNMLRYAAKERRNFNEFPLNEIDSMIFSQLAYCNFDALPRITSLQDLASDEEIETLTKGNLGGKNTEKLIKIMIKNPRFKNVSWQQAVSKIDAKTQMQFNAVTFYIADGQSYIAYRGTTATTIGWKENFNMSFNNWVPAHYFARSYYRRIKELFPGKFYLGGHSKGGNLAFAVALSLNESDLSNIVRIDCFDGPGFHNQDRLKKKFLKLKGKIHKYIPQGSLIGILQDDLIGEKDYCTIVAASGANLLQHDMFTWRVKKDKFVTVKQLDSGSEISWKAIAEWLKNTSDTERKDFIEMLYLTVSDSNQIYFRNLLTPKTTYKLATRLIKNSSAQKEVWKPIIRKLFKAYVNSGTAALSEQRKNQLENFKNILDDQRK